MMKRRNRGAPTVKSTLAMFAMLTALVFAFSGWVIAENRLPEETEQAAEEVAPQLDRIQPGASEQQVRQAFGRPTEVREDFGGSDRCLFYTSLPYNQSSYRFCFERGALQTISAD